MLNYSTLVLIMFVTIAASMDNCNLYFDQVEKVAQTFELNLMYPSEEAINGISLNLTFRNAVKKITARALSNFEIHVNLLERRMNNIEVFVVTQPDRKVEPGETIIFHLNVEYKGNSKPNLIASNLNGQNLCSECGLQLAEPQNRLMHGLDARPGEFPWVVTIFLKNTPKSVMFSCAGAIINARNVLTAAHCLKPEGTTVLLKTEDVLLYVGLHNLHKTSDPSVQEVKAKWFETHRLYNPLTVLFDIGMIRLQKSLSYTEYIRPICLPFNEVTMGMDGVLNGWGKTEYGVPSTLLQKASLPVVSLDACRKQHSDLLTIMDNNVCIGYGNGTNGCKGDSGGSFLMKEKDDNGVDFMYVRGLVSKGIPQGQSCDPKAYIVLTDVFDYNDYILSAVRANEMP